MSDKKKIIFVFSFIGAIFFFLINCVLMALVIMTKGELFYQNMFTDNLSVLMLFVFISIVTYESGK